MSDEEPDVALLALRPLPFLLTELEILTARERALKEELGRVRTAVHSALLNLDLKGEMGPGKIRVGLTRKRPAILRAPGWLTAVKEVSPDNVEVVQQVRPAFEKYIEARAELIWSGKEDPASDTEKALLGFLTWADPPEPHLYVRWVGDDS